MSTEQNINENKNSFEYTYSSKQHDELAQIRKKYLPKEAVDDRMERIRRLDALTEKKGVAVSVSVGTIGTFLLGWGMCATMVFDKVWFVPGIIVGVIGIALVAAALPVYRKVVASEQAKVAPEILALTEELSKEL